MQAQARFVTKQLTLTIREVSDTSKHNQLIATIAIRTNAKDSKCLLITDSSGEAKAKAAAATVAVAEANMREAAEEARTAVAEAEAEAEAGAEAGIEAGSEAESGTPSAHTPSSGRRLLRRW